MNWQQTLREVVNDACVLLLSFNSGKARPWNEFFTEFTIPPTSGYHLETRIMTNLYYFMINYLLFIACIVVLHMIIDPVISLVVLITFRRIRKQNRVDEPELFYIAVYVAGMYMDLG
ncbi:hypothetical protein JH06_4961 [Blastocystis sp. subtype 4]|uniref:hypothetical protein n=1 Tax=Blastocystis sp. subtype 4 TaxID=944170 RepID=UPI0007118824|nr:hypothetical protein JH06_4961 [Blastocystis sp. subtype 4]KNB41585.1 hypothetical protein JH06_4961 [Blastocystis sp. subtype 4]|eukprot:XP_014525028.1 hypothetical protein JH06_4961 [Blastocystis sp. subtype 4]